VASIESHLHLQPHEEKRDKERLSERERGRERFRDNNEEGQKNSENKLKYIYIDCPNIGRHCNKMWDLGSVWVCDLKKCDFKIAILKCVI
jgi:hypothetical protein